MVRFPPLLRLRDRIFQLRRVRQYAPVAIYRTDELILRIGEENAIAAEISAHRQFEAHGMPVATICDEGRRDELFYYIEESLGGATILDGISLASHTPSPMPSASFYQLLRVTQQFVLAQLKGSGASLGVGTLSEAVHQEQLLAEMPHLNREIANAFEKASRQISAYPLVLNHGDLSAANLFTTGVIDFERAFVGPFGYDVVTNVYHTYCYPPAGEYEKVRRYVFTVEQRREYFAAMDDISSLYGMPKITCNIQDFIILRVMMFTARMDPWPNLQKWLYARIDRILDVYLNDGDLCEYMAEDRWFADSR